MLPEKRISDARVAREKLVAAQAAKQIADAREARETLAVTKLQTVKQTEDAIAASISLASEPAEDEEVQAAVPASEPAKDAIEDEEVQVAVPASEPIEDAIEDEEVQAVVPASEPAKDVIEDEEVQAAVLASEPIEDAIEDEEVQAAVPASEPTEGAIADEDTQVMAVVLPPVKQAREAIEEKETQVVAVMPPEVAPIKQDIPQEAKSRVMDLLLYLMPLVAFLIWCMALPGIHLGQMNDLGLVSVFPPSFIAALALMTISFCLELRQPKVRSLNLLLHFGLIIFMLYGVSNLIEEMPRFAVVYRHTGYTEYIMRTGSVDPNLDAYFSWPGFFSLSAFLTKIAGYPDILSFAGWAPVFFNVIYFGPLYALFTSFTQNKRIVWFAIWLFYLTNWIGQDYYSPQGLNFFLYLVVIVFLVRWFKLPQDAKIRPLGRRLSKIPFAIPFYAWLRAPDPLVMPSQPRQRQGFIVCILIIFSFIVFSHQLTPFFVILSVGGLVLTRRCRLAWLLPVMLAMTLAWVFIVARPYIVGHQSEVFGNPELILSSFTSNVSNRVAGDPQHTFIARIRIVMSMLIWGCAFLAGVIRYRKGYKDATIVLLGLTPFPLFIIQPYGGEMLLRAYLFSLPSMLFLISSCLYEIQVIKRGYWRVATHIALCLVLLGGFLFTRYGNESMDYMTKDEVAGVRELYHIAPVNSMFLGAWEGSPWQLQDFEKYSLSAIPSNPDLPKAVHDQNMTVITQFMYSHRGTRSYLIFTRSERQTFNATAGMPAGTYDTFEKNVAHSNSFLLVYQNPDAQIFQFIDTTGGN